MPISDDSILDNAFLCEPQPTPRVETQHRRIVTPLPSPQTRQRLLDAARVFPQVNCYQPPVIWDRARGYQVWDEAGNCWIDFSSTAVLTNTGHGHAALRSALREHAEHGLLAQFNFASDIRIALAEELLKLAPRSCEKVYFWTVGSEANEAALRLAREWGRRRDSRKTHVISLAGNFHGWTLGAHELSGASAQKPWLPAGDPGIHHLPFPGPRVDDAAFSDPDWGEFFDRSINQLGENGVDANQVAAVFVEAMQGWGALPLPVAYVRRLRQWCDAHDVLLIFDEIQTGFGRTGRWFAHEHYGVLPDLICLAKGLTSSLPLAALLGPGEVMDTIPPGEITTTHAGHPMSCAAALSNLRVLQQEQLIEAAAKKGSVAQCELAALQQRFPDHIAATTGLGLLRAIHVTDPGSRSPSRVWARDWIWAAVKHGVMLFQVNKPTLKVCPPLIIPEDALCEGIRALGDALETL
jgi:4-aminobutyrate aminotransferase/diaminobutyrate-pyruvate transaminase/4-aminobutyrate aminotransferase/(S)-3-amino-2-methylpropionate transaminase